jgi:hypothetical protein
LPGHIVPPNVPLCYAHVAGICNGLLTFLIVIVCYNLRNEKGALVVSLC